MSTRIVFLEVKAGCVGPTALLPSCADCLEILGASTWASIGIALTSGCWTRL